MRKTASCTDVIQIHFHFTVSKVTNVTKETLHVNAHEYIQMRLKNTIRAIVISFKRLF